MPVGGAAALVCRCLLVDVCGGLETQAGGHRTFERGQGRLGRNSVRIYLGWAMLVIWAHGPALPGVFLTRPHRGAKDPYRAPEVPEVPERAQRRAATLATAHAPARRA